jgi:hypothetical protein
MSNITIDGKEYDTETMSEEALSQLQSLQFVENDLVRIQLQAAAMQTARNAYARALKSILEDGENTGDDSAKISIPDDLNFD